MSDDQKQRLEAKIDRLEQNLKRRAMTTTERQAASLGHPPTERERVAESDAEPTTGPTASELQAERVLGTEGDR